jgi:hypothetical protein
MIFFFSRPAEGRLRRTVDSSLEPCASGCLTDEVTEEEQGQKDFLSNFAQLQGRAEKRPLFRHDLGQDFKLVGLGCNLLAKRPTQNGGRLAQKLTMIGNSENRTFRQHRAEVGDGGAEEEGSCCRTASANERL